MKTVRPGSRPFALRSLFHSCLRLARNVMLDLRYGGIFLGGIIKTRYGHLGAHNTVNTDYGVMPYLFRSVEVAESDVLVDVGCGKGRIVNWWLAQGLKNKIIGVEIDPVVASQTKRRLIKYKNVQIVAGNILDVLPPEGTICYLYNPFSQDVIRGFKDSLAKHGARNVRLIYYFSAFHDSVLAEVFRNDPRWTIRPISLPSSLHLAGERGYLIEPVQHSQVPGHQEGCQEHPTVANPDIQNRSG